MIVNIHKRNNYPFKDMGAGGKFFVENYSRIVMTKVGNAGRNYYRYYNKPLTVSCKKEGDGFWVQVINIECQDSKEHKMVYAKEIKGYYCPECAGSMW